MKMTSGNKAVTFLGTGLLIISCLNFNRGENALGICFLIGAFGCGIMLYADTESRKKHNK